MITFFTIPKSFKGHISVIQKNAIKSWIYLHPDCEIILYGDEEGIREIANEYGLIHISHIEKNKFGTPYLDFVFNNAQKIARNDILCYSNTDIIFFKDFIKSIQDIKKDSFLAVGRHWNIPVELPIDFSGINWENNLRMSIKNCGSYSGRTGLDYFAFPKKTQIKILPFLVGRKGWDNWMIYHARKERYPVIDISRVTTVIHQNHDYDHVPFKRGKRWQGPESDYNENLMGKKIVQRSKLCLWSLDDAEYYLTNNGLCPKLDGKYYSLSRKLILLSPDFLYPFLGFLKLAIIKILLFSRNARMNQ